ncbi:MAG: DUF2785 domain-containing protein [Defluviitaleaceae bacterium]|nr:DUF2785 domain-containing protein [Defluviitaleaceae bacterium]
MDFKTQLINLKSAPLLSLEDAELDKLISGMLENIGSPDPELRDGLIFNTFVRIIDEEGFLGPFRLLNILETALDDNHLFHNIGNRGDDTVFTRSFSALAAAAVLHADARRDFLSQGDFDKMALRILRYLPLENDTRGYVSGKGWAHSIAHGADLLVELVRNPKFANGDFVKILDAIKSCLFKSRAYSNLEDARLFAPILAAYEFRGLMDSGLCKWLSALCADLAKIYNQEGHTYQYHRIRINLTNFLKTIYFEYRINNQKIELRDEIVKMLSDIPL